MSGPFATPSIWLVGVTLVASAALCYAGILLLWPWLARYALARPNARSSHTVPTPQGGGIAVVAATLIATAFALTLQGDATIATSALGVLAVAVAGLGVMGGIDDVRPLNPLLRIGIQAMAIGAVLLSLPDAARVFPSWPFWLERAALLIAAIWFVNLMNFMDGLDWITVAETVPIGITLMIFGLAGLLPTAATAIAAALTGAMLGFAPFNRPVARLFLGDVGSIAIGLIVAWLLFVTAASGHLAAAILLPLYYLCDATITLLRRLVRSEKIWQAHRGHFYQRATDNGLSVRRIVGTIFCLNLGLAALALVSVYVPTLVANIVCLALGLGFVGLVLARFSQPSKATTRVP